MEIPATSGPILGRLINTYPEAAFSALIDEARRQSISLPAKTALASPAFTFHKCFCNARAKQETAVLLDRSISQTGNSRIHFAEAFLM